MQTLTEFLATHYISGDRAAFFAFAREAQARFRPEGILELHFSATLVHDLWRLRLLAAVDDSQASPEAADARLQYRDRLNNAIRRNTRELRRLQTDRILAERAALPLPEAASTVDILRFEKTNPNRRSPGPAQPEIRKNEPMPDTAIPSVQTAEARLHAQIEAEELRERAEYKQRTKQIPRNAPCPCKSGDKYKRCCGKEAPPVLNQAA